MYPCAGITFAEKERQKRDSLVGELWQAILETVQDIDSTSITRQDLLAELEKYLGN